MDLLRKRFNPEQVKLQFKRYATGDLLDPYSGCADPDAGPGSPFTLLRGQFTGVPLHAEP